MNDDDDTDIYPHLPQYDHVEPQGVVLLQTKI